MMKSLIRFSLFTGVCAVLFSVTGCETEVDLNADYKSTTVIFALLDADANGDGENNQLDTQWVRINRTFLGEGNNLPYAQVRDSSEYHESDFISKKVTEYNDGNLVNEWNLTAMTVSNKSINGIFYGPEQTLYFFTPTVNGLNEYSQYRLELDFANKEDVSGETNIINGSQLVFSQPQIQTTITMASGTPFNINYTDNARIKWFPAPGAKTYDAVLRFHYREITYTDDSQTNVVSSEYKSIDFNLGSYKVEDVNASSQLEIEFNGESFFTFLGNKLTASPLIRREIGFFDGLDTRCFDIILSMGNDDLNTYIEVNSPASGIVQERPTFGNVSNALGIFAARSTRRLENLRVIASSSGGAPQLGNLHALCTGSHTINLNFCDPNPTSDYACN